MEKHSIKNKYQMFSVIFGIIVVVLVITVFLQNRRINALNNILTESTQTALNPDNYALEKNLSFEDDGQYNGKIKKLESQIADMESWQDYLENALQKSEERNSQTTPNRPQTNTVENFTPVVRNPATMKDYTIRSISRQYDSFIKE